MLAYSFFFVFHVKKRSAHLRKKVKATKPTYLAASALVLFDRTAIGSQNLANKAHERKSFPTDNPSAGQGRG